MPGLASSIMSLFTPAGGAKIETPQVQGNQPNNPTQVNQPGNPLPGSTPGNPTAPIQDQNQNQSTEPVNPLDAFKDLWTAPEGAKPPETVADMFKNLDVKKLNESASAVDFKGVATQEQLAKINAGGADAMSTMLDVMNAMAQRAYANATLAGVKVTEQALGRADKIMSDRIPGMVRNASVSAEVQAANEAYSHPAMQPVVQALQTQMQVKYPMASAAEIKAQVVEALSAMGQVLNPPKSDTSSTGRAKEEDWSKFIA